MFKKCKSLIFFCSILFLGCYQQKHVDGYKELAAEVQAFETWKQQRIDGLTSTFGWLSVSGLVWLKKDTSTIGTDLNNDVTVPFPASANFGTLQRTGEDWSFIPHSDVKMKIEEKTIKSKVVLQHDQTGQPTIVNYKSIFWHLIKRGDNYGIRIKDTLRLDRFELNSIPTFEYNNEYVFEGEVIRATKNDSIVITNVQGVAIPTKLNGWLKFNHKGKDHSLACTDGGKDTWFVVFGDETNSAETYGAGRFIYVNVPPEAQTVKIDFNRAENPPCYFTAFATCPLPHKENVLKTSIRAGERSLY